MASSIIIFAAAAVVYFIIRLLNMTDRPKIKGLPEPPGIPLFGNLLQLGDSHARRTQELSKQFGPVFQTRLGYKRIIFVNSFDAARELYITNQSALISRPTLYTFNKLSSSEGLTLGSSPWDASLKARRKALATALNRPAVLSYMCHIDYEASRCIKEMLHASKNGTIDVDPKIYLQRFSLSTALTANFGIRIEGDVDDALLQEIVHVEKVIDGFRGIANNWQDYIPLLRLWPRKNQRIAEYRMRRGKYIHAMLEVLKKRIAEGTDKPCITGTILKDHQASLNDAEIMSLSLSVVAAGLETVSLNLVLALAYLSSPNGQSIQTRAYREIMAVYPTGDAWERCLHEEEVPYMVALVKEVLRYWTVGPLALPRASVRDVHWNGAIIPAGSCFYMNAYAANYDEDHFKEPCDFNPDRFSSAENLNGTGIQHFAFGAGARMCPGSHLADKELYTALLRFIIAFEILPSKETEDRPILDYWGSNMTPSGLTVDPRRFKVGLKVRDPAELDRWIGDSEQRTAEF